MYEHHDEFARQLDSVPSSISWNVADNDTSGSRYFSDRSIIIASSRSKIRVKLSLQCRSSIEFEMATCNYLRDVYIVDMNYAHPES